MQGDPTTALSGRDEVTAFLALSPDGVVVVDGSGVIVAVNAAASLMFGYPTDELVGRSVDDLVPAALREAHQHVRASYLRRPRTRAMGAGLSLEAECRDGTLLPVDISLSAVTTVDDQPVVIAVVRDMSAQRRSERVAARLAALVRSTDAALLSISPERRVDSWNSGAAALFGYTEDEILGSDPLLLVPARLRDEAAELYTRVADGERLQLFDTVRVGRDGSEIPTAITLSAMHDSSGAFVGWSEVIRDQTDRLRIQSRLAAAEADRKLLADRERIARDLHDVVVQRIFAAAMGLQGIASSVELPDVAHERVTRIIGELDTAVREIRTSIFTIRRRPGEHGSIRGQLLDIGTEMSAALGYRPEFDFRGPVDIVVPDEIGAELRPVLREALANIAKHAHATQARVRVNADVHHLTVIVSDNGVGLSETGRRSGLANMTERAERFGGTLKVDTAAGAGTTLVWSVPLSDTERDVPGTA